MSEFTVSAAVNVFARENQRAWLKSFCCSAISRSKAASGLPTDSKTLDVAEIAFGARSRFGLCSASHVFQAGSLSTSPSEQPIALANFRTLHLFLAFSASRRECWPPPS